MQIQNDKKTNDEIGQGEGEGGGGGWYYYGAKLKLRNEG